MNPLRPLVHWSAIFPFGVVPEICVHEHAHVVITFAAVIVFGAVWAGWRLTT